MFHSTKEKLTMVESFLWLTLGSTEVGVLKQNKIQRQSLEYDIRGN